MSYELLDVRPNLLPLLYQLNSRAFYPTMGIQCIPHREYLSLVRSPDVKRRLRWLPELYDTRYLLSIKADIYTRKRDD